MPLQMKAKTLKKGGAAFTEQFSIRCPAGTAERLEEFRREYGLRSRAEAINELLSHGWLTLTTDF